MGFETKRILDKKGTECFENTRFTEPVTTAPQAPSCGRRTFERTIMIQDRFAQNGRRVLVADQEEEIRLLVSSMLADMNFKVVSAGAGPEALSRFAADDFALVFADAKMICADGHSLAYHVKTKTPETRVVMMAGRSRETYPDKNEGCCIDYLLFKPFSLTDVRGLVHEMFGDRIVRKVILKPKD